MNCHHLPAGHHSVSGVLLPDSLEEVCIPHPLDIRVFRDILYLEIKLLFMREQLPENLRIRVCLLRHVRTYSVHQSLLNVSISLFCFYQNSVAVLKIAVCDRITELRIQYNSCMVDQNFS